MLILNNQTHVFSVRTIVLVSCIHTVNVMFVLVSEPFLSNANFFFSTWQFSCMRPFILWLIFITSSLAFLLGRDSWFFFFSFRSSCSNHYMTVSLFGTFQSSDQHLIWIRNSRQQINNYLLIISIVSNYRWFIEYLSKCVHMLLNTLSLF